MNIAPRYLTAYQRGQYLEQQLARALEGRGWRVRGIRQRCPYGEVDILAEHGCGYLLIVEVKSLSQANFIASRLGMRQKQRLRNCFTYFQGHWVGLVVFGLAMIETNGEVTWFGGEVLS